MSESLSVALGELDQLASCANILLSAVREEDPIAFHYGVQGTEFSVMRVAWMLGEEEEAGRIHADIGDHSPDACPICTPSCLTVFGRKEAA